MKDNEDIEAGKKEQTELLYVVGQEAEENEVKDDTRAGVQEGGAGGDSNPTTRTRSEGGQIVQQEEGKEDVLSQTTSCASESDVCFGP